jgi:hypothetical protein
VLSDGPNELSGPDGNSTAGGVEQWYTELDADPTGGKVTSTEPALVLGGHTCTPIITSYCDHLEHALLPDDLLGTHYVAGPILERDTNVPLAIKIVAIQGGTNVEVSGSKSDSLTLGDGESATLEWERGSMTGVDISSNNPVSVILFSGASRSPSMTALAPESVWRRDYTLLASPEGDGFAQVIAAQGTALEVDGDTWDEWTALDGPGNYVSARVPLAEATVTQLQADQPVHVVVYGFSAYASYVHLGGFGGGG